MGLDQPLETLHDDCNGEVVTEANSWRLLWHWGDGGRFEAGGSSLGQADVDQ